MGVELKGRLRAPDATEAERTNFQEPLQQAAGEAFLLIGA
jgi:hypothetical protein